MKQYIAIHHHRAGTAIHGFTSAKPARELAKMLKVYSVADMEGRPAMCPLAQALDIDFDGEHDGLQIQLVETSCIDEEEADKGNREPWVMCMDCGAWNRVKHGNHHPWCNCGSDRFNWSDERTRKPT